MRAYDSALFDPPAPLAHVTLRNPDTHVAWSDVPMLLDSGADVTLIPHSAIDRLGLATIPDKRYELAGFDGNRSFADGVQVELVFSHLTFRGRFLLIEQPWGILGRNILNTIALLLDGPNLKWDEQSSK